MLARISFSVAMRSMALAVPLVITACAGLVGPAKVVLYDERRNVSKPAPMRVYAAIPANRTHVVLRNDTVHSIARRYGLPVRTIIEANGLKPPYRLLVGQRIRLPAPREHKVARGETIYGIARRYGVAMSRLVRLNGIRPPYRIYVGQTLRLPARIANGPHRPARRTASSPPASAKALRESGKKSGREMAKIRPRPLTPPPRSRRGFIWPVRGKVISGFGPKGKGLHNDGINVAAPRGTPVRAAENGVVAYAGNELRGFGNLVLLKHEGGYMTAYAHNNEILVKRGQRVMRGQPIARVGSTGNVATPQLHFEIRKGRRAIDPMRYLRRSQQSRR